MTKNFTLLALGDSYTIGESVPLYDGFPYQAIQLLRKAGIHFHAPEIVAKTGWTSFELAEHILHMQLNEQYDFVTLLIGVNNQYRELSIGEFKTDFEFLLRKAIHFTGERPKRVIVISIPDWGVTPFAVKKDNKKISDEIIAFNQICETEATKQKTHFINITEETQKVVTDKLLLAKDQLHYSAKAYAIWADKIASIIKKNV